MSSEDLIETIIGKFGKYQTWILFLVMLGRYPSDFQLNNVVFILPNVNYVCLDPGSENKSNVCPCENPKYDRSVIENSVISEWHLICERAHWASLSQSMLQVGILVGSLVFGYISDRFGRKPGFLISIIFNAIFICISGVVPEFWMFLICRLPIGVCVGGTMLSEYVLLIELSGRSFRSYLIGLHEISFVTGYFLLAIIAYYIRDWRDLQLITSLPWILVIGYYWLIPESPRWLITAGKRKEVIQLLTYISKKNNRRTDNIEAIYTNIIKRKALDRYVIPAEHRLCMYHGRSRGRQLVFDNLEEEELRTQQKHKKAGSYVDLFRTPKIRFYTLITALIWMSCSHTFFGINQYIGLLQGNIYLNVMLSAGSLAPTLIIIAIAAKFLNRKVSLLIFFIIASMSFFLFAFVPHNVESLTLVFAILGQTGAYAAFILIYLYTSELFPTVIRNSAIGFCSVFARIGGFIAPFVVNAETDMLSMSIFSAVALGAGLLTCLLPETKDITLLNSIEQTEDNNW